ncbi:transcriptional regulatory, C terminal family protein [Janthinobacterium agaricidamnosum NBRC 102515 = DSM 9628]|uniref:Transcriptional regulatory, C terminal family protein n=1 Tax=Janthinobacterium agaricidamnosum NBRC 102515 = DSM 9628 TaxID=1349767 RepID=W0V597_9BURK|nr:transcriptional regulatory, C terminal family protein [Janthinobacterium agaricidamnosum NBRC 102515 = DSM 9628]
MLEDERALRLGSRAMDLLLILLERAGEIVDKNELLAVVWPDSVVDDATLRVHLAALRKVLGDGRDGQRYITTIPGRGYGFLAPLSVIGQQFSPLSAPEPRHNLPVLLTRVIGRSDTITAMANNLLQLRLLCIVGPGGIGKTSVAVALAGRVLRRYADGICFVDLAPLAEGHLVPSALATALGIALPAHDPMPGLLAHLRQRHMLIVLDNCEHVIDAAAWLADALLKGAPLVHIIATSREPLRIASEHLQRLQALELPPVNVLPDAAAARHYASVQLFCERCAAVLDNFVLRDADVAIVADICRKLDGIPLALELAAGRIDHFGLHELSRQLNDCFRLLTRGPRNAPARHQTLRATLDWSYRLLDDEERSVLQVLSVFKNSFRMESAAAVAGREVFDAVSDLAAKSLVSIEFSDDTVYYRLLDTTRAYAAQQLAASPLYAAVSRRYAEHCGELAQTIHADWERLPAPLWTSCYGRHVDDVRAAIDWAFGAPGNAVLGIGLTIAARTLFYQLSLMDEYRARVELALRHMAQHAIDDRSSEMQLHTSLAHLSLHTGGATPQTDAAFQRAYQLALGLDDPRRQAEATCGMWIAHMAQAEFEPASQYARQFGELSGQTGDTALMLVHARMMCSSEHLLGRHEQSIALARLVLAHPDSGGRLAYNSTLLADHQVCMRGNLSRCLWITGTPDDALALACEAVALGFEHNGVSLCMALAFGAIPVALWCGRHVLARTWAGLLNQHATRHGLGYWSVWGLAYELLLDTADRPGMFDGLWAARLHWPLQADIMSTMHSGVIGPQVLQRVHGGRSPWSAPEVLRRDAERRWLLLAEDDQAGREQVQAALEQALRLAREQGALAWELRCATSLARVMALRRQPRQARDLLQAVYAKFGQGHTTADLIQASVLIGQLS